MANSAASISTETVEADFNKEEMRRIFGEIRTPVDWHNVVDWASEFNKSNRQFGAKLKILRLSGGMSLEGPSNDHLSCVADAAKNRQGAKQRAFGAVLALKLTEQKNRHFLFRDFQRAQTAHLKKQTTPLLKLPICWHETLPDSPMGRTKQKSLLSIVQQAIFSPQAEPLLVIGETSIGKTTLLYRALEMIGNLEAEGLWTKFYPVYVPSDHIQIRDNKGIINWEAIPCGDPFLVERMEPLFREGRLLLLIDTLERNRDIINLANSAALSFWNLASRNRLALACHSRFYASFISDGPLGRVLLPSLRLISMVPWKRNDFEKFYEELALKSNGGGGEIAVAGKLRRLAARFADEIRAPKLIRMTPLTASALAQYYINRSERLPDNEYELLEVTTTDMINHEIGKGNPFGSAQALIGFLMRLAWRAYERESSGGTRPNKWRVSWNDVETMLIKHYPHLSNDKTEILISLTRTQFLDYDDEEAFFNLENHFTEFLAARFIIKKILTEDIKSLLKIFTTTFYASLWRYLALGVGLLDKREAESCLNTLQVLYGDFEEKYKDDPRFSLELSLGNLAQLLGKLNYPLVAGFLHEKFSQHLHGKGSPYILMSTAIGGAYAGQRDDLELFVKTLETSPKLRNYNRKFRLWASCSTQGTGIDQFDESNIPDWSSLCDGLLDSLTMNYLAPIRALHLFTLWDFMKNKGTRPFSRDVKYSMNDQLIASRIKKFRDVINHLEVEQRADPDPLTMNYLGTVKKLAIKEKIIGEYHGSCEKTKKDQTRQEALPN